MSDVWEKRPGEGERAFAAFTIYRNLGPQRSLSKVAQAVAKSLPLMKRWSRRWRWSVRASAWDAHLHKVDDNERRRAVKDACARHVNLAQALQHRVTLQLKALQERDKRQPEVPVQDLTAGDMARWLETGVRIERLGLGLPTSNHSVEGPDGGPLQVDAIQGARKRLREKLRPLAAEAAAAGVVAVVTAEPETPDDEGGS